MVGGRGKVEYPPLLDVGWHPMTMPELRELCVDPFTLSTKRESLFQNLSVIVDRLEGCGVEGELWLDGSFVTEKVDPDDVDLVLFVMGEFVEVASDEQNAAIEWVSDNLHDSHKCDSYVHVGWAEAHPNHAHGEWWRAYWLRQWGFSGDGTYTMKGIAVLKLGAT